MSFREIIVVYSENHINTKRGQSAELLNAKILDTWVIQLQHCIEELNQLATSKVSTGRSGFDLRRGQRIFPVASVSRPALGPTQPPVQWVPGVLSPGVKRGRGVMLTTQPYLVPRSRMSRSYTSSPPKRLHGV
jgi:hypothetical protein